MPVPEFIKYFVKGILLKNIVTLRGHRRNGMYALTFDDGPNPEYSGEVLEILDRYNVRATFFFVGEQIDQHPEYVSKVIEGGHEFGCHTMTHSILSKADFLTLDNEVQSYFDKYKEAKRLFRPPHGKLSITLVYYAFIKKIPIILWNTDAKDFRVSAEEIKLFFNDNPIQDGDIVLLHDKTSNLVDALEDIIRNCRQNGLKGVTVSELMKA